jgi:GNAT superfamily N-acetyltransferase
VAIVGTLPEAYGEEIIAVGRYYLDPRTNRAEVAFTVRDEWQRRGIGTFLLKYLITLARRHGIAGFTAEVLAENKNMQAVLRRADLKTRIKLEEGVYHFEMDFE